MLTIFTTPKPFQGHVGIIQRNAIGSWLRLHPECEVILFGNEPGTSQVAAEFGIRQVPDVTLSERGGTQLDNIFRRAQEIARHSVLCYANCDIILLGSPLRVLVSVLEWSKKFLVVGRRWNTPVDGPLDFEEGDWRVRLRDLAMRMGEQQFPGAVDYFIFPRGLYRDMPPFVVGRTHWDHWMVWKARSMKVPVVDASADILAIHQNHDFTHHPEGLLGIRRDVESKRNRKLAGGQRHLYTIEHATHTIVDGRIEDKPGRWHVPATFFARTYLSQLWYWVLKSTFRARHALGLCRDRLQANSGAAFDRLPGSRDAR
jgi:hypothetical protein